MDLLGGQQSQQRLQGVADDQFLVVGGHQHPYLTTPQRIGDQRPDSAAPELPAAVQPPQTPHQAQNTKLIPMMGTSSTSTIQSIDHIYPTRTFRDSSAMTEVMIWSRSWRGTNPVRLRSLVQSGMRRSMSSKPGP